jgi:hypothetical protein
MVKFSILFYRPQASRTADFEAGYTRFLAMVEQIPDIQRRQVVDVLARPEGPSPFHRILEIYFTDQATMSAALNTEAGQRAGAALYEVFKPLGFHFDTFFADVYEETGGRTPPPQEEA